MTDLLENLDFTVQTQNTTGEILHCYADCTLLHQLAIFSVFYDNRQFPGQAQASNCS